MMNSVIGVDIGKNKLNYCVLDDFGEIFDEAILANNQTGYETILRLVHRYHGIVVFEATGVYSARLQYFLELNDLDYVRLNPLRAKRETSTLRNTKNDKVDAKKLALLQLTKQYPKSHIEARVYKELRRQHRFYQSIAQERVNAKNRVHRLLQETFPSLTEIVGTASDTLYKIAMTIPHVNLINNATPHEISELLSKVMKYDSVCQKLAQKLKAIALTTTVSVDVDSYALTELRYWAQKVLELGQVKERILQEMVTASSEMNEVKILRSIPGLGDLAAVGLVAELGDIRRFTTPQKMNAFVGIDLIFNDSGQLKTSGFISKKGNSVARKLLYTSFLHVIMADREQRLRVTQWYRKRSANVKRGKKKLIIGGMDRLLRLVHHLVINNEEFQFDKSG